VTEVVSVTQARSRLGAPRADRAAETPRRVSPAASSPGRRPTGGASSRRRAPPNRLAVGLEPAQGGLHRGARRPRRYLSRRSSGGRRSFPSDRAWGRRSTRLSVPWTALTAAGPTGVGRSSRRSSPARSGTSTRREAFTEKPPPPSHPRLCGPPRARAGRGGRQPEAPEGAPAPGPSRGALA
jgi:hypothetical protein